MAPFLFRASVDEIFLFAFTAWLSTNAAARMFRRLGKSMRLKRRRYAARSRRKISIPAIETAQNCKHFVVLADAVGMAPISKRSDSKRKNLFFCPCSTVEPELANQNRNEGVRQICCKGGARECSLAGPPPLRIAPRETFELDGLPRRGRNRPDDTVGAALGIERENSTWRGKGARRAASAPAPGGAMQKCRHIEFAPYKLTSSISIFSYTQGLCGR